MYNCEWPNTFLNGKYLLYNTDRLSVTWGRSYGNALGWLKARLGFAVIRATYICLRGSRVAWRSGSGIDDGAGLPDVLPMHH